MDYEKELVAIFLIITAFILTILSRLVEINSTLLILIAIILFISFLFSLLITKIMYKNIIKINETKLEDILTKLSIASNVVNEFITKQGKETIVIDRNHFFQNNDAKYSLWILGAYLRIALENPEKFAKRLERGVELRLLVQSEVADNKIKEFVSILINRYKVNKNKIKNKLHIKKLNSDQSKLLIMPLIIYDAYTEKTVIITHFPKSRHTERYNPALKLEGKIDDIFIREYEDTFDNWWNIAGEELQLI